MCQFTIVVVALLVCFTFVDSSKANKNDRSCEVCVATVEKFRQQLGPGPHDDLDELETHFRHFCKSLPVGGKEHRFCYFLGATEDAATRTVRNLVRPLSYGVPSDKICHQLKTMDPQICELRFDVKPDFTQLNKMKVGDLRKILTNWGEGMACAGCMEKGDYVKVVRQLMPKYEPEQWRKIEAAEKSEL
ncbi:hypothetical protein BsWGS_13810 [Bradybaena similaris]